MRLLVFLSLFSFHFFAAAEPERIEVIFLSEVKLGSLLRSLDDPALGLFKWSALSAQSEPFECVSVGDKCFHPQLGLVDHPMKPLPMDEDHNQKKESSSEVEVKTINSESIDLVGCDKNYHFDIFCGKAAKLKPRGKSHTEVWVDTSSSMRKMDWSKQSGYCERRRLVAKLQSDCPKKLEVYTFDTGKKSLGSLDGLCMNYGMNDSERVVQWIKSSKAKNLFIITDVDEYNGALREYLDIVGARIVGVGTSNISSKELFSLAETISKTCR